MRAWLDALYRREQFDPGLLGVFVNPFFLARRRLRQAVASMAGDLSGRLLDVGCGTKPYRELFKVTEYVGLDIDSETTRRQKTADVLYDGCVFPFDSCRFDSVLCNQVLEHVFEPDQFLAEIHRILTPGGKLLLTLPFVWDEHEQPWDYARYSSFGLKYLLQRHGFVVTRQEKLLDGAAMLFQLLNTYCYKVLRTRSSLFNLLLVSLVMAPISVLGLLADRLLPRNPDLFLDQIIVAERSPE